MLRPAPVLRPRIMPPAATHRWVVAPRTDGRHAAVLHAFHVARSRLSGGQHHLPVPRLVPRMQRSLRRGDARRTARPERARRPPRRLHHDDHGTLSLRPGHGQPRLGTMLGPGHRRQAAPSPPTRSWRVTASTVPVNFGGRLCHTDASTAATDTARCADCQCCCAANGHLPAGSRWCLCA